VPVPREGVRHFRFAGISFPAQTRISPKANDTNWLRRQSRSDQSPAPNSLLAGNLAGNFADSDHFCLFWHLINEQHQWLAT
jgi:hypothetical protein